MPRPSIALFAVVAAAASGGCGGSEERGTSTRPAAVSVPTGPPADVVRDAEAEQQHQSQTTP